MSDDSQDRPRGSRGIYVVKGMSLRLGKFSFSLGDDGLKMSPIAVELALDMTPFWLQIAMSHLDRARSFHTTVLDAHSRDDDEERSQNLEFEFLESMQAIVAAAVALDAFHASIKEHVQLPAGLVEKWRERRTARYKQVVEVLRRAFILQKRPVVNLRRAFRDVYRFRDWAVHPSGNYSPPVPHPDLEVATEWRFVAFSYGNARKIVRAVLAFAFLLTSKPPSNASEPFVNLCKKTLARIDPLCSEWRARYGRLTDSDEYETACDAN
jgi:hypothetical protein